MPNLPDWLPYINSGGVVGLLAVAVWAFATGKVISRGEYDRLADQVNAIRALINELIADLRGKRDG